MEICHAVTDPGKEDVGERCRSLTDGAGVSVVLDCAGVKVGLEAGMEKRLYVKSLMEGFHVADGSRSSLCHWPDSCLRRSPRTFSGPLRRSKVRNISTLWYPVNY